MYRLTYCIDYAGKYKNASEYAQMHNRLSSLLDSIPDKITRYHTKFNDRDKNDPQSKSLFKMCLYLVDVDALQGAIIFLNQYCNLNALPLDMQPDIITLVDEETNSCTPL